MVQRLPDPRLVTDSMSAGGVPRDRYSMTAPGSPGIESYTLDPAIGAFDDLGDVPSNSAEIPVSNHRDRYSTGPVPGNAERWVPTPAATGSFDLEPFGHDGA